jgi:EAL domain-containing protein (putative c-di-GMP-specific phosphodiesterase class I)
MSISTDPISHPTELAVKRWVLIGAMGIDEKDREIPITGTRFVIGRRPDRDLVISHPTVSGCHAEILRKGDALLVRDLGSTNGTRVNEQGIELPTPLHSGDRLCIGNVELWVQARDEQPDTGTMMASSVETSRFLGFGRLLTDPAIIPYFQPIVNLNEGDLVGYEVLARSEVPGFETPCKMISVAEQMGLEHEFSDVCRVVGVKHSQKLTHQRRLYLNTHSAEVGDPELIESLIKLRSLDPNLELTLEIHEALVTRQGVMTDLRTQLNDLNIQLAYDDFGAGQTRLLDLSEVPPDTLKFDISLIRGLHEAGPKRQQMVATLVSMVLDFGITPLAEGIETREDMEICREIGFELAQGYFFERPRPVEYLNAVSTGETTVPYGH